MDTGRWWISTFSTLQAGRTSATNQLGSTTSTSYLFQYPPSGSNLCNYFLSVHDSASASLSVPSKRVEPLQPCPMTSPCEPYQLSVPSKRVEPLQPPHAVVRALKDMLSVPSKRVEPLQQNAIIDSGGGATYFQYPPSGSNLCNTEAMQRQAAHIHFQYPPSGSNLCNTVFRARAVGSWWVFQYPPSGSNLCNLRLYQYRV